MKTTALLCAGAAVAGTMMATPAFAQEAVVVAPAPTTVVVHEDSHAYPGLIWGGLAMWAVFYAPPALGAAVGNDACSADTRFCLSGRQVLYIPIAGPFIAIPAVNGFGSSTLKTLLAFDGALQAGGIGMMITGIVLSAGPSHRSGAAEKKSFIAKHDMVFAPLATGSTAGLRASGTF